MKITQMLTKESVFITGIGQLGKNIGQGSGKFVDAKLEVLEQGVEISLRGKFAFVPWGSINQVTGVKDTSGSQDS